MGRAVRYRARAYWQRWVTAADPRTGGPRLHNPQDFVRIEIRRALARNIPVVPVILDGAAIPEERSLPDDMRELAQRQSCRHSANKASVSASTVR